MSRIKIAILDFDGTLSDTTALIVRTTQAAIKELGLPAKSDEECASMIGLRLVEIPPVLFPGHEIDCDLYAATYRRLFHEFDTDGAVKLYPNVIETLKEIPEVRSCMMYVSDHGESLGENNLYMHGVPMSMAPAEQVEIPFIVWDSDENTGIKNLDKVGQYHVFHSIMNFLGIESPIFDEEKNIFE